MKTFIFTAVAIGIFIGLSACGSTTKAVAGNGSISNSNVGMDNTALANTMHTDTVRIANDSLEYEVIIIDPGFNSWLYSRAKPRGYYGEPYLRNKNLFWVTEWNVRVNQPQRYGDLYQLRIDYDPHIEYGYEVNYLLYNYLVYFQISNNQRLGGIVPQY